MYKTNSNNRAVGSHKSAGSKLDFKASLNMIGLSEYSYSSLYENIYVEQYFCMYESMLFTTYNIIS